MDLQALLDQAIALHKAGRIGEAEPLYAEASAAMPDHPLLLFNHGLVLQELNRYGEALTCFDKAVAVEPGFFPALNNRGLVLAELKRFAKALASYDAALAIKPDYVEALNNRGYALADLARFEDALASFDRVPGPAPLETLNGRGLALTGMKRFGEALESYDAALAINPRHAGVLNNRGLALAEMGRHGEALASYDAALAADPNYADALYNRGTALVRLKRLGEALASHEKALARDPGLPDALGGVARVALGLCDWSRAAQIAAKLQPGIVSGKAIIPPLVLMGYDGDAGLQLICATNATRHRIPVTPPALWQGGPNRNAKIRLMYLSAIFHTHPTASLIAELFERHDRSRFEVCAISFGPDDGGALRARLAGAFDRFSDMRGASDLEIARFLHANKTDIAIDLMGHTPDDRPGIFSHRPAPVQVNYLGYPGTSGAGFMDYVVGDPVVTPFEQQAFFSEKIVQLPDCYQANDSRRAIAPETPSRAAAGLPAQAFVFCCFNNNWKITEPVFTVWMRLLAAVPGSVLWLLQDNGGAAGRLRQEAGARGIDPARLVFAPRVAPAEHLARHRLADLFVDTLPYNAHTTASDALWAGLSLVTCRGQFFPGRVAASLLGAIGLPELITENMEDYEALALRLAHDGELLGALKEKLAQNRLGAPLFDSERFRRNIEAAYVKMWEIAERGGAPRSFRVES
jgi:predicted O-linked N-acetylglucosamine transferase (SPINDLY family)